MLSAGKSLNTEHQLNQNPAEVQRFKTDVEATLDERGIEAVQAEADELAQTEIREVHHLATVRPEDVELAPDEAREIQESVASSEKGIEEARQKLMDTISEAVRSATDAQQAQEQSEARRAQDADTAAEAEEEKISETTVALAAETQTDQAAESAAVAAVATEAHATANVQTENAVSTVSEMILARDEAVDTRSEDAVPLAEDPAARQQQVMEQGDQSEVVDTSHENPGSGPISLEHLTLWKNGYSPEAMGYLQKKGESALAEGPTGPAREASNAALLALDQARRTAHGRRMKNALDNAIGLLESIPFSQIERMQADIASEQHAIIEDERLVGMGEIDPTSFPYIKQFRLTMINGMQAELDKISKARTEVLASYQEALQEIQEASQDTDFEDEPSPVPEAATEAEPLPAFENGITAEVMAYLNKKAEGAFLSDDTLQNKSFAMSALKALDQLRMHASDEAKALIDEASGYIESIPFDMIDSLPAAIRKQEELLREEEEAVRTGEMDMASYQHIHAARILDIQGSKTRLEQLSNARRDVLKSFQDMLGKIQQLAVPAREAPVPPTPVATAESAAIVAPVQAEAPPVSTSAESTAPSLEPSAPVLAEVVAPSVPVAKAEASPIASAAGSAVLQLESGTVSASEQPSTSVNNETPPPAEPVRAKQESAQAATPPAAAQSKRESAPQGDPTLENGFTKEMIGYLRAQAQEAFLNDDPSVRKAGFRKLALATHSDRLAHLDAKAAGHAEALQKIVNELGGDNISVLKTQIKSAEEALQETQRNYDRGDIDDETFANLKRRSERIIANAQRDITYDRDRRQALFDRYQAVLNEIENVDTAPAPDQAQEKQEADVADNAVDVPSDKAADQDQADQNPGQAANPDQAANAAPAANPDQQATPDQPPTPDTQPKRKSRAERLGERRKERIASAREFYKNSQQAVRDQEKLISDFKLDRGADNLHAVEVQYIKLMEMRLDSLKMEEQMAKLELRKLEAEDEMAGLLDKQANAKTEGEKAQLQEQIEDLEDEILDIDDELLHLKKNLESLAKKEQLLEGEYRTALQQMPDTLEGESLLTEDKQQATGEKEQTVKEEGITPEMPKDQAPGFGDKLGQLWDQAKKTVTDLIE